MNIYPYLTVEIEASLKQHGLLPQDEYITWWKVEPIFNYDEDDLEFEEDTLFVRTSDGNHYDYKCDRG